MEDPHIIILSDSVTDHDLEWLVYFSFEMTSQSGLVRRFLRCSEVDASHHIYIQAKTLLPNHLVYADLRIPHHLVLMIWDDPEEKQLGFLSIAQ